MFNKVGSQLQILNSQHPLYKVASAGNNIVTAKSDNFTYFQTIALHADVPNLNGDVFPLDELKKSYKSFIGRGLYLDHNAQSVANAVGKVFDAKLIEIPGATEEEGKYGVVCLCGVDKVTHPDIAAKVAHGVLDSVSMGASVGSCTCGICGVKCSTPEEFCVHLQHQGQIDPDTGKKCTSINHDVSFTELSIVGVAADPYAKMQQVFADFVGGMTKVAGEPKQFLEKFSFSIPCGNEKLCEMIYNLLDGYKKQGIMDLSADGSILKLSVEAKSEAEALKKLESISQEQGLDVEKPLQKEEKSMSEEIKPVEEQVEKTDLQEVQSSNTQSNEVKDVKAEEKKEEETQEKTAAMVPPFTDTKEPAAPVADPIVAPVKEPEAKPEIPAPAPEVKPLKDAPLADAPMGDKPLGDKPMADKPAVPPMADGKEKFEEVKPEAPADKIKTTQDAAKALLDALKAGENADLKALEDVINFLKADKKEAPAKEEKKDDKKDEKKEDKTEDAPKAEEKKDAPKEDKKDDKEPAKEEKKDDKPAEEKKAEAESTTKEIPVEAKKEEKEEVKPTFANVTRVSLLKTANILDSKWVFHLKGTNKVACLSIKNLLPGVSEKVAYLTSKEFYNEMMSTLEKHAALNEGAVKEITANFNEKVKVDSDEKKSQIAKATNKVKVETDAKKVSDTASKVTESLTDDGKAQKQDKVNSKEDAGAIESASKKAPVETDIKVDAAMESKLKQVTAALEAKEAELNQLKLHQALEAKTAKARNIVSMSIKAGLVKCNEQFRQEELLKQASPVKAKEEAMRRTADAMVKDLLGMSDDELDRQASYLSNFKVEAEVKQLKPIKIEASYNESNEASIIEALAAQMM